MSKKTFQVGLFGLGTVGQGVAELLLNEKWKSKEYEFVLRKVVVKHLNKERSVSLSPHLLTTNPREILEDSEIDTIIEVMGGINPAREITIEALQRGKNVITANKALLARSGSQLFKVAAENNCYLGVRASNIASYRLIESLVSSPSNIEEIVGIFNGTCNYILTEMEQREKSFSDILKKAQKIGYTERDSSDDIDGYDTAHKLVVLLGLSSGHFLPLESLFVEGIRNITLQDILFARELGYRIKLLAIARRKHEELEARVHPALLPRDRGLARLGGIENGIEIRDETGVEVGLQAPGAGRYPTATAILEDLVSMAKGGKLISPYKRERFRLRKMEDVETKYYLRFSALDRAGVLAKISGILGNYNISIKAVLQKGERKGNELEFVPIIMLTHRAKEKDVQNALQEIDGLSIIKGETLLIRVEEGIF